MILFWKSDTGIHGFSEYKKYKNSYITNDVYMFFDNIVFRTDFIISKSTLNSRIKYKIDHNDSIHKTVLMNLFNPKYTSFRVKEAFGSDNAKIIYKK